MLPNAGDIVMISNEFINRSGTKGHLSGKTLYVLKVDLNGISNNGPEYTVWVQYDGIIDGIDVYGTEGYASVLYGQNVEVFIMYGVKDLKKVEPQVNEDDRCKKCGSMGEVIGMACKCPACGAVIWGI